MNGIRGIRDLRERRGLTIDALAILGGVDIATISRVERGLQRPRPETVVQLARALGISARRMQALCNAAGADALDDQPTERGGAA